MKKRQVQYLQGNVMENVEVEEERVSSESVNPVLTTASLGETAAPFGKKLPSFGSVSSGKTPFGKIVPEFGRAPLNRDSPTFGRPNSSIDTALFSNDSSINHHHLPSLNSSLQDSDSDEERSYDMRASTTCYESLQVDCSFGNRDMLVSYLIETGGRDTYRREDSGPEEATMEMIMNAKEELKAANRRRSYTITSSTLSNCMSDGTTKYKAILPLTECDKADICDLMLRGKRWVNDGVSRSIEEQKNGVAKLVELMMMRAFEPIKVSDWEADDDEYYISHFAGMACRRLPPGIMKLDLDCFVMGDSLESYIQLFKIVYSHELKSILEGTKGMSEKDVSTNLWIDSLTSLLSIGSTSNAFATDKRGGDLFITIKPHV